MNSEIRSKRAELKAGIVEARATLDFCKRCKADLAKQTAMLQKKKACLSLAAPFAKGALTAQAVAQANGSFALATAAIAKSSKSVAVALETATQLLQALQDELNGLKGKP